MCRESVALSGRYGAGMNRLRRNTPSVDPPRREIALRIVATLPSSFRFSEKCLTPDPNQFLIPAVSSLNEGRIAVVTDAGWDAVDAAASSCAFCARTSDANAYGEVVWF
jgi:hypothetical protein